MIAPKSVSAGSVPKAWPRSPASRDAQKASATAGGAWRTSSEPWSASAMRSTTRRARASMPVEVGELLAQRRDERVEARRRRPRRASTSAKNASSDAGLRRERAQHVEAR